MIFTWKNVPVRLWNFLKIYLEHTCIYYIKSFLNFLLQQINSQLKKQKIYILPLSKFKELIINPC